VKTDVHYPTDINLLLDAMRKIIFLLANLCEKYGIQNFRQYWHNFKKAKRAYRKAQKMKRSTSKNETKKANREATIKAAYEAYLDICEKMIKRSEEVMKIIPEADVMTLVARYVIAGYIKHAKRQIDQVNRRVLEGEKIPHEEKVFSIFEEHTEWISKGKAGVPQELGLKVCVIEDQFGFILNHKVMQKEGDEAIAISLAQDTKLKYENISSISYDKGFYNPANKEQLKKMLEKLVMPKKGKLSRQEKEEEYDEDFKTLRRKHSAVESGINALQNHGLKRCRNHGIKGFKNYVA